MIKGWASWSSEFPIPLRKHQQKYVSVEIDTVSSLASSQALEDIPEHTKMPIQRWWLLQSLKVLSISLSLSHTHKHTLWNTLEIPWWNTASTLFCLCDCLLSSHDTGGWQTLLVFSAPAAWVRKIYIPVASSSQCPGLHRKEQRRHESDVCSMRKTDIQLIAINRLFERPQYDQLSKNNRKNAILIFK